ncbi:MAG: hypothetical protein AB7U20_17325, partial [Planctomycetaceae bacterium]
MREIVVSVVFVLISLSPAAHGENWGHWRGPGGNGAAINASPPTEWSSTKNVKWKVELPRWENSSPVVWDNQVFVSVASPIDEGGPNELPTFEFKLLSLNRDNGDLLWQQTATVAKPHQASHNTNGFAGASPCTDGQHVYAHFGSRGLYCYTMDGEFV